MVRLLGLLLAGVGAEVLWKDVCTQADVKALPFCDLRLPIDQRAADYVHRLKPDEKVPILSNEAKSVDRLHIPPYQWGSEGLHGPLQPCVCDDAKTCRCPTSFPMPSALGCTFNDSLVHFIGTAIGVEARAINNLRNHVTQNNYGDGLDYWSPTINMQRDPRWGRNMEVPGEDPVHTSNYAVNFVKGLQAVNDDSVSGRAKSLYQIIGTCKHYVANSLEGWHNYSRHNFDAQISAADLADYYLVPFKACVMEGKAKGIMCSYNAVNGVPMCANSLFLNQTLREAWGFDGYVTSDCDAVGDVGSPYPQGHAYASMENGTALSLKAGTDMDCGDWGAHAYQNYLPKAVDDGLITEADLDTALLRLTKIQMSLGLFDNDKASLPYFTAGTDVIDTPAHQVLAMEAALQSIVLLKNDKKALPLKAGLKLAVIGPHFASKQDLLGNYIGSRCVGPNNNISVNNYDCVTSIVDALTGWNKGGTTTGQKGCEIKKLLPYTPLQAVALAEASDAVVLTMGTDHTIEREGKDRLNTSLPGMQVELAMAVARVAKAKGAPCVLVLLHGGMVSLGPLGDEVSAVVDMFYTGEAAAEALARILYGAHSPSGKLAATAYPESFVDALPLTDMSLTNPPGRTYMHYMGTPEYKFGFGLSYSTFALSSATPARSTVVQIGASATAAPAVLDYVVNMTNTGTVAAKQTVFGYIRPQQQQQQQQSGRLPLRQRLFAYQGAHLQPRESASLRFSLDVGETFARADLDGNRVLAVGAFDVVFNDGSRNDDEGNLVVDKVRLRGATVIVENAPFAPRS